MRRTYNITVETETGRETIKMRLTLGAQIALKRKLKAENDFAVVEQAMTDTETMVELLTAALGYKDNTNAITDGAELYDTLVDNGFAGIEDFIPIVTGVANASGLLSDEMKAYLDGKVAGVMDDIEDPAKN